MEPMYVLKKTDSTADTYYHCHGPFRGEEHVVKQTDLKYARTFPTKEDAEIFNADLPDWLRDRFLVKEVSGWEQLTVGVLHIPGQEKFSMDDGPLGLMYCFD